MRRRNVTAQRKHGTTFAGKAYIEESPPGCGRGGVMARKRSGRATPARRGGTPRRRAGKAKSAAKRAPARRSSPPRVKKKASRKPPAKRKRASPVRRSSARPRARVESTRRRGLGLESGGQSGDTERISRSAIADSESVEELLEEGQAFEAGVVDGVENAPDADQGEVRTREVPEDDVPQEYLDED